MVTKKKRPIAKKPTPKKKCPLGDCRKGGKSSRGGGVAKRPPSNPLPTPTQPNKPTHSNSTPPKPPLDTVKHNNMEDEYTEDDISDDEKEVVTRSSLLKQQIGSTVKQTIKGALIAGASAAAAGCVQGGILGAPLGVGGAIAGCTNHGIEGFKKGALVGAGVGAATGLSRSVLEQTMFEPEHPDKSLRKARRIADVVDKAAYSTTAVYGGYKAYKGWSNMNNTATQSDSKLPKQIMDPVKTQERWNKIKNTSKKLIKGINDNGQMIIQSNALQKVAEYLNKPAADILKAINKDIEVQEAKKKGIRLKKEEANRIVSDIVDKMFVDTMDQIAQKEQSKLTMEGVAPIPTVKEASKAYEDYSKTADMWENLKAKSRGLAPMEVSTSPIHTSNKTSPQPQLQSSLPPLPPSPSLSVASSMDTMSPVLPPLPLSPSLSDISMDTAASTASRRSSVSPMMGINQSTPSPPIANVVPGTTPAQAITINKRKRIGLPWLDPTGFYQGNDRRSRRLNEALYGPSQLPLSYKRRRDIFTSNSITPVMTNNNVKTPSPIASPQQRLLSPPPSPISPPAENLTRLPNNALEIVDRAKRISDSLMSSTSQYDNRYNKKLREILVTIRQLQNQLRDERNVLRQKDIRDDILQKIKWVDIVTKRR